MDAVERWIRDRLVKGRPAASRQQTHAPDALQLLYRPQLGRPLRAAARSLPGRRGPPRRRVASGSCRGPKADRSERRRAGRAFLGDASRSAQEDPTTLKPDPTERSHRGGRNLDRHTASATPPMLARVVRRCWLMSAQFNALLPCWEVPSGHVEVRSVCADPVRTKPQAMATTTPRLSTHAALERRPV
jgi:hypothetical protein